MLSWILMCALVIAFSAGVIFAFMLPAWLLIVLQAFFIIALAWCVLKKDNPNHCGCDFFRRKR